VSKLNAAKRRALPEAKFALSGRRYPVEDKGHAEAARARVEEFGTPAEKATVFRKTAHFFGGGDSEFGLPARKKKKEGK